MKNAMSVMLVLLAVFLSGCGQEKVQVETFLKELDASEQAMKATAKEMEASMGGLQAEMAQGNFDAEKIKGQIKAFEEKMKAEKDRVAGLAVPEKCKALHETTVKQYEVAVNVIGKTPAMVDIAKVMTESAAKLKDPKQKDAAMGEMQSAQTEMMKLQGEIMELAKEGQDLETKAKDEKKKLQDEFQLAAASPSPASAPTAIGDAPAQPPADGNAPAQPAATPAPATTP